MIYRNFVLVCASLMLAACNGSDKDVGSGGTDSASVDLDADGDGYLASDDCNDADPTINPSADEECDGADNNCDGQVDEDISSTYYSDADGDGFGDASTSTSSCASPDGYVPNGSDCDDEDGEIFPGAEELCDGIDNDCNDAIDDGATEGEDTRDWYVDADDDGYGAPGDSIAACGAPDGYSLDDTDCDDAVASTNPGADELCNQIDDDCDTELDEEAVDQSSWYADADADDFGDADALTLACDAPTGFVADDTDCDDAVASTNPGADELCDDVDNDCDSDIDEDAVDAPDWYADLDADTYGDPDTATASCDAPSGYVADYGDCDDDNARINPSRKEKCNSIDDDCDGEIDDSAVDASTWYADTDADSYGDAASTTTSCTEPTGYVSLSTDCDDGNNSVYPGADEYCDTLDNDCDGKTDESAVDATTWYKDRDTDGYGDASKTNTACTAPTGYVAASTDCDDRDSAVYPGATEHCDGDDEDCDGTIDESAVDMITWYKDRDSDLYGDPSSSYTSCTAPTSYVSDDTDCDDRSSSVYPGAAEVCEDGADNDCDGIDAPCGPSGSVSLAAADGWLIGETSYDYAGFAVCAAGDTDGDGYDDVLIGAIGEDTGGSYAGAAYLVGGPISGDTDLSAADAKLSGESTQDKAGSAVAGAGDIDGDGYDDVLVGSKEEDSGGSYAGAAYVVLGPISSISLGKADAKVKGSGAYEYVGASLADAGDMDGDGYSDILLGAYGEDTAGASAGAALLFYGPVTGTKSSSGADVKLTGEHTYDFAGYALDAAGDVDGDGLGDILVGSYGEDTAGTMAGAAYLVLGGGTGTLSLSDYDAKLTGSSASEQAGSAVASAGDTDGDGYDDLIVGAYGYSSEKGRAYLVLGPLSGTVKLSVSDAILNGVTAGDRAGWSVDGAGDVDKDGYADLLIGAYREDTGAADAGAAFMVHGPLSGSASLSAADANLSGEAKGDYVGYAVSSAGDVNGDTFSDLLIGAYKRDDGGADAGGAYLVTGGTD